MSIRPSTKAKKDQEKAAAWLAKQGISIEAIKSAQETTVQTREEVSLEAEAVLSFLENPVRFVTYKCKRCGDPFGTNYKYNRYCSDTCRAKSLRDMGIIWDQHADAKERWGGEPPLTIPANAIQSLLAAAEVLRSQSSGSQSQTETQSDQRLPEASTRPSDSSVRTTPRVSPETTASVAHTSFDFALPELSDF